MQRRLFLQSSASTAAAVVVGANLNGCTAGAAAKSVTESRRKPPFRVLYSNDATNITSCVSPFHKAKEPFRQSMIEATVDEVEGLVDAHFLQPGLGLVPMWPSKVLPLREHYDWIQSRYKSGPDSFGRYVMNGGDVVKVFLDRCQKTGQAGFISLRLNDVHHKEFAFPKPGDKPGASIGMSVTQSYVEHPEWIIKAGSKRGADLAQNWIHEEVRQYRLNLIQELCENYDLAGLELDFMRFYRLFDEAATTLEQRRQIMTAFVSQVRDLLDRTQRTGRRWLCLRIPGLQKGLNDLGLDLPALVAAGVDVMTLSASYFTSQQLEIAALRAQISDSASVYLEMCHSVANGSKLVPGYDTFTFRRTTREQYETTAHLAHERGADGVSLFNFAYYREHGSEGRGPFAEPPFEVLAGLRDRKRLAALPQHWFLAKGWDNPWQRPPVLPRRLSPASKTTFTLDMAPPASGWKGSGVLRLQARNDIEKLPLTARCNGLLLLEAAGPPASAVAEPFPNPYPIMLGKTSEKRAWQLPASCLNNGKNFFEFSLGKEAEQEITVDYLDIRVG